MDLNEYQKFTRTTAFYPEAVGFVYCSLGLAGEAGEVANNVKKEIRDGVDKSLEIRDELGDVLWYVARLADEYGFDLAEVAQYNIDKLNDRLAEKDLQQKLSGEDYQPNLI